MCLSIEYCKYIKVRVCTLNLDISLSYSYMHIYINLDTSLFYYLSLFDDSETSQVNFWSWF